MRRWRARSPTCRTGVGARYVDVAYADQHVRRSMIEKGSDEILEWSPAWAVKRIDDLGNEHGALISITGDPEPELLERSRPGRASARRVRSRSRRRTFVT